MSPFFPGIYQIRSERVRGTFFLPSRVRNLLETERESVRALMNQFCRSFFRLLKAAGVLADALDR